DSRLSVGPDQIPLERRRSLGVDAVECARIDFDRNHPAVEESVGRAQRVNVAVGVFQLVAQAWHETPENVASDGKRVLDGLLVSQTVVDVPARSIWPLCGFPQDVREVLLGRGIVDHEGTPRLGYMPKRLDGILKPLNTRRIGGRSKDRGLVRKN